MQAPPTAFLFPGQGSQFVGMGRRLAAEHAIARATFEEVDDALGAPLTHLCGEGPEAELVRTEHAQPAILAVSIATWRVLANEIDIAPSWLAGHSLGEYSALVVAGALDFADALRLVRTRGRLMQAAVPQGRGTMAAIVGLAADAVARACEEAAAGAVVAPANVNGAGQIVIAGERAAVRRAMDLAKRAGGRAIELAVSAPFHCSLMAPAAAGLAEALAAVEIGALRVPVVSNVEATVNGDRGRVAELLIRQVTAPVQWEASMQLLQRLGCARALEIGPGQVLTRLLQRMQLGIDAVAAGEGPVSEWRRLEPARARA